MLCLKLFPSLIPTTQKVCLVLGAKKDFPISLFYDPEVKDLSFFRIFGNMMQIPVRKAIVCSWNRAVSFSCVHYVEIGTMRVIVWSCKFPFQLHTISHTQPLWFTDLVSPKHCEMDVNIWLLQKVSFGVFAYLLLTLSLLTPSLVSSKRRTGDKVKYVCSMETSIIHLFTWSS